ncbi:MAG TPA: fibronectin type III domain-containing protein [Solirubrobacteraceae bacterium]|nr:fibronectin type III domain-containing protein [Solirubrobacteraceae bacterium]
MAVLAAVPTASEAQGPTPINLQLTPEEGAIKVTWGVSSTTGLTGFRIRLRASDGGGSDRIELPRGTRSYTLTRLRHTSYDVRVRALHYGRPSGLATASATPLAGTGEPEEEIEEPGEEPEEETPVEEPEEEKPVEEPLEEENPGQGVVVSGTPTGPPTPAGGWSVVYADGFGAPFGKGPGQDNTWFPNNCTVTTNCRGFNSDEMEVMNPSQVHQTAEGLKLTCTYSAAAQSPGNMHYVCGTVRGPAEGLAGYAPFKWSPGKGQTMVFQAVAKFPPNTGEADPGWWTNGPPWSDTEIDFFEGGGSNASYTPGTGWRTVPMYTSWFAAPHPNANKPGFTTDPSLAYHTYTFEIKSDNTYSVWIDGVPQSWATNVGPVTPDLAEKATLILSYALRTSPAGTLFTSGTREFDVRSVSVYEDKEHKGVGVENAGVAPGTVVSG